MILNYKIRTYEDILWQKIIESGSDIPNIVTQHTVAKFVVYNNLLFSSTRNQIEQALNGD